ncbi:unnamed protein product [Caenorhabditis bovis]|uniref:Uncharacterized protein n=1 Tax=Caenorhabditis bovis TaxID=2654633 RepID=A0A8S1EWQ2_9PELO|nr:unnamed protein product [Caenorhabditis bovis]
MFINGRLHLAYQTLLVARPSHFYRFYSRMAAEGERVVHKDEMRQFMVNCMTKVGTSEAHAVQLADVLLEGDIRGHYSHGLNRLEMEPSTSECVKDVEDENEEGFIGNPCGLHLLDYEKNVLAKTLPASTLFIVANGLGVERLFLEHLLLFSDRRLLALVLNTTPQDDSYFISKLKEHNTDCVPKVINSDVSIKDRQSIYLEGGVQFCSSRVILVDLLQNRIPVNRIAAIFVYRAHQTLNSFQESFILRLYREKKLNGMVKAFTDNPNVISSLGQLQRLIDRLYIRHVELLPRFSSTIETELNKYQLRSAVFSVEVVPAMRRIHRALMDFIKVCIRDLRTCSASGKQTGEENEEMIHVPWAPTQLEKRPKNRKGFISDKQQRLINDAGFLREILQMSENLDPATVYARLQALKNDKTVLEGHSGWLLSPSFSRIMEDLQILCGISIAGKGDLSKFVQPAKWNVLAQVLEEIKRIPLESKDYEDRTPSVIVLTNSEDVTRQVADVVKHGNQKAKWMAFRQLGQRIKEDCPESEPLWEPDNISILFRSQLDSESELIANVQKTQKTVARATQKRRKAAEELIGNTRDSQIQTTAIGRIGNINFIQHAAIDE